VYGVKGGYVSALPKLLQGDRMRTVVMEKLKELCLLYVGDNEDLQEKARDVYFLAIEDYEQGDAYVTVRNRLEADLQDLVAGKK